MAAVAKMPVAKRSRKSTCTGGTIIMPAGDQRRVEGKVGVDKTRHVFRPNPFDKLPIELRQMLAGYVESDKDLTSLRRVCRSLYESIDQDGYSFWRSRFLDVFDAPVTNFNNSQYKTTYQERQRWLCRPPTFELGNSREEVACLKVLRDLILEAWAPDHKTSNPPAESRNVDRLVTFGLRASNILENLFAPALSRARSGLITDFNPLLLTIQVVLTPLNLHLDTPEPQVYQFPDSQFAAYSSRYLLPLFGRSQTLMVDMEWVLHQVNFWKYHMLQPEECTLYATFANLSQSEKPQFWTQSILRHGIGQEDERHMGKRWLSCFAFMDQHDLLIVRNGENDDDVCQDTFEFEGTDHAFPELQLELDNRDPEAWPKKFEDCLSSLTPAGDPSTTRSQSRCIAVNDLVDNHSQSFRLRDIGDEASPFYGEGWITALPAQTGIPGFRRMTMMKHQNDPYLVSDKSWAYEGVVFPGGKIVLGRWWSPIEMTNHPYSGPFIMWCVDKPGSPEADETEDREASGSRSEV